MQLDHVRSRVDVIERSERSGGSRARRRRFMRTAAAADNHFLSSSLGGPEFQMPLRSASSRHSA